jgi:hypothetical protein
VEPNRPRHSQPKHESHISKVILQVAAEPQALSWGCVWNSNEHYTQETQRDLGFSQRCSWETDSCGMWRCHWISRPWTCTALQKVRNYMPCDTMSHPGTFTSECWRNTEFQWRNHLPAWLMLHWQSNVWCYGALQQGHLLIGTKAATLHIHHIYYILILNWCLSHLVIVAVTTTTTTIIIIIIIIIIIFFSLNSVPKTDVYLLKYSFSTFLPPP